MFALTLSLRLQVLVEAMDKDKSGTISREEFDTGFNKLVANMVRRGSIAGPPLPLKSEEAPAEMPSMARRFSINFPIPGMNTNKEAAPAEAQPVERKIRMEVRRVGAEGEQEGADDKARAAASSSQ
jgi:hypothetical protein